MFSRTVTRNDRFLDMAPSTQNLYFHLGIEADDDGFVSPKMVMRTLGATDDELRMLAVKGFVIPFESGVVVITDWKENNYIQSDRYKPTVFTEEFKSLTCIQNVYKLDTQVRLGKSKIREVKRKVISSAPQADAAQFILEEKLEKMESKPGSHLDIIATFIRVGKLNPKTSAELTAVIKRYAKIATTLTAFVEPDGTMPRIFDACKVCQDESHKLGYQWSLDTVYKKLTK